ncbi:Stk1 family PASTA domain-containing Ser/Thr kinase [Brevibacterium ihuae]|uniref:Stk1 family PASTA domain-containing Ser/Thr kinase n=1 Tax=Brevibacterium ihuae TaxID=1631743 RepID=UPI000C76D802|nr:Stk1 family PASTA domain-containing Ser/Thr kinase [Brevibacterium ihuae]
MSEVRMLSGRYEVRELLGRGGMAEVHAGVDTRLGRRVAIKLLRSDLARDPSFHARLKREAQSAAGLNHPGIVAVYDSGEQEFAESGGDIVHVPFIVMEMVEGRTLRQVLTDHGRLTVREALDVTAGVLAPLDYSHRNGIVHRDIKPGNVMLTPEGDIKVMDFGIARALEDTGSLTQTQSVVGTAQYLSPEQARGEIVDARSDLYSTACLLYELLVGRPPFVGDSQLAVAYQHVGEDPKPPSHYDPEIPPAIDRLLLHALQKDRTVRYQDAHTFREDVLAARDGRPLSFEDDADATQAFGVVPGAFAAGAAGAGLGAAAAGPGSAHPPTEQTMAYSALGEPTQAMAQAQMTNSVATIAEEDSEPEPDERSRTWLWVGSALLVLVLAGLGLFVYTLSKEPEIVTFELADLRDRAADDAEQYLLEQGLRVDREETADDDIGEGNVVNTDPPGGSQVTEGDLIVLFVSTGPDSVEVPDVAGDSESLARQTIGDAGLTAGSNIDENSPDVDAGTVIETRPEAGSTVAKDSTVDLVLSTGMVDVPDVLGMTEDEACETLAGEDYQLDCTVEEAETADHPAGEVFEQSTEGGGEVSQGSAITITVATAPPTQTPTPEPTAPVLPWPTLPEGPSDEGDENQGGIQGNTGRPDEGRDRPGRPDGRD